MLFVGDNSNCFWLISKTATLIETKKKKKLFSKILGFNLFAVIEFNVIEKYFYLLFIVSST